MIISFSYTTSLLLKGFKTETRRNWKPGHIKHFRDGRYVDAWDALPYNGGKPIAKIVLTKDPYQEPIKDISPDSVANEGFDGMTVDQFLEEIWVGKVGGSLDDVPTVIEFRVLSIRIMAKYPHSEPFRTTAMVRRYPRQGDHFFILTPEQTMPFVEAKKVTDVGGHPFYYLERV